MSSASEPQGVKVTTYPPCIPRRTANNSRMSLLSSTMKMTLLFPERESEEGTGMFMISSSPIEICYSLLFMREDIHKYYNRIALEKLQKGEELMFYRKNFNVIFILACALGQGEHRSFR